MPRCMEKQWQILDPDPDTVKRLGNKIGCSPLLARLLALRGFRTEAEATRFLSPSLNGLTPPLTLAGMTEATRRIRRAIIDGEQILIYGDYDVDGITATALLVKFLRRCGADVSYYIPHRPTDGYGLGTEFIVNRAKPAGVRLIITVDCGSANASAVDLAREMGIDTIITDHHPVSDLPEAAVAVVNPTRADCPAGIGHLAGVGVAFYLAVALRSHLRETGFWKNRREPNLKRLCDLVAMGTVADVAPLVAENRTLTATGLAQLNTDVRPGIAALMDCMAASGTPLDTEAIAFRLAPRLNAAGRLAHARLACQLLLTDRPQSAKRLADALCRLNTRRQELENRLVQQILDTICRIPEKDLPPAIVVEGQKWHEGILGIVASRLARQFNRPAVVISTHNGTGKGSARSVPGIDVSHALSRCADLLTRFGGHPQAAGLALRSADIAVFRSRLEKAVAELAVGQDLQPKLPIDARLPISKVGPELMMDLDRLGPFGQANPYPLFMADKIGVVNARIVGGNHLHRILKPAHAPGPTISSIQFNVASGDDAIKFFDGIVYRPQWNYWNGRRTLQLLIEDTRQSR